MDLKDFEKLPPDTIVTEEMLDLKVGEFLLVISNYGKEFQEMKYSGTCEIEAYKKYKAIPHNDKIIARATATYTDLYYEKYGIHFLLDYEIFEIVKEGINKDRRRL